ncbi:MAG: glycoside hydrolase family 2, partial [Dysgonamonadaceae bacterium]|nr:glycoside hydrolase family 2 [Dysgonamonadaceae bacterium]
ELHFDAVAKVAEVYINGRRAGNHTGMFGDFSIDGKPFFKPGKNRIDLKVTRDFVKNIDDADKVVSVAVTIPVTNRMLNDLAHGFYQDNPAGIWQPVHLVITPLIKIEDVYIRPHLTGADFEVTVKNYSNKKASIGIHTGITEVGTENALLPDTKNSPYPVKTELKAGEEKVIRYSIQNLKPRLWTPQHPNLYRFLFQLTSGDQTEVVSGFRTFEVKNGLFELNGVPYWLRGGNHTPFALAPNDSVLANSFYQLMKAGNIDVTRTHTTPYNELWITAADRNGIGISHEGTWPWLMIHDSMPTEELLELWKTEYLGMLKKYRNHPSILFWTINNEMKFYDLEPNFEKAKEKMRIISEVVKEMRQIDPTRPISFDSNYRRNVKKFGEDFYQTIDDGDIDDVHAYINWYDHSIFKYFNGEFQKYGKNPGRPLISQEMSTGYPNNETGHPTRFYNLVHQNPQTLVGYQSYEFADPSAFLQVQAFITGELAEALRRSNDQASGILHFALLTWFRNVYDAQNIEPYPTYYALKRALQPVLVSAELWGRHFYAGESLPAHIYVVNDREDGRDLQPSLLYWEICSDNGKRLAAGASPVPAVKHYSRQQVSPLIKIPQQLPQNKTHARLKLRLTENGVSVSENEYDILLADKAWSREPAAGKKITLVDFDGVREQLDFLHIHPASAANVAEALKSKNDLLILSGMDKHCSDAEIQQIKTYVAQGGKVLLLRSTETAQRLYPEYITGHIVPTEGDIVNMEIPEAGVFDGIDELELRYFNNNRREIPVVCYAALQVNRNEHVVELANQTKIHGYIEGDMEKRTNTVQRIKGFPLLEIREGGSALISTMATDKAATDPVAGKLLTNMINYLIQ